MTVVSVSVRVSDPQHRAAVQTFAALLSAMNSPYGKLTIIFRGGRVERGQIECGFNQSELDLLLEEDLSAG